MKTVAFVLVAAVLAVHAAPAAAQAEEKTAAKPAFSFSGFFKNLRDSVEKSAVAGERKKGGRAAVAAVRGAGQKSELADPNEPTLKGDSRSKRLAEKAAQDAEIYEATKLVEAGKHAEALAAFEAFQKKHPKSHKENVATAISELKKALAGAEAAPAGEAKPEETKAE
ncbi:MAG: hypothetical protein SF051_08120 [Elusimicrobiota bacterium]|nr:hypothetical protein [Elusimicrobiota bacterium]